MPGKYLESDYEPIDTVPADLKWKPAHGRPSRTHTKLVSTPGSCFRLERDLKTGQVRYFRLKNLGPEMSPKDKIDAEPEREEQIRYRVGAHCWYIEEGRWFLVEVVDRLGYAPGTGTEKRLVMKSVTGFDADRVAPWPFGELYEIPADQRYQAFQRLRPLRDRHT